MRGKQITRLAQLAPLSGNVQRGGKEVRRFLNDSVIILPGKPL